MKWSISFAIKWSSSVFAFNSSETRWTSCAFINVFNWDFHLPSASFQLFGPVVLTRLVRSPDCPSRPFRSQILARCFIRWLFKVRIEKTRKWFLILMSSYSINAIPIFTFWLITVIELTATCSAKVFRSTSTTESTWWWFIYTSSAILAKLQSISQK